MTMEQQHTDLKNQLMVMGYTAVEADRAINAGHRHVSNAVAYIEDTPSAPAAPPEKTAIEYPRLPPSHVAATATSSQSPASFRGLTNARDSLDRIEINRVPGADAGPGRTADGTHQNMDDDLQRAMALSRQEQEERFMAQALQLSKQEGESAAAAQTDQDPELRLAIQESLKDPRVVNDRAVSWQSHGFADVKERARKTLDDPVGLKNIGNTCYLNSLLQVYYHLPDFRRAIMSFRAPEEFLQSSMGETKGLPIQVPVQQPLAQQPMVETPEDEVNEHETPEEKWERNMRASQLDQSFDLPLEGDRLINPTEGMSGMSDNHMEDKDDNSAAAHAVQFVVELQKLFASMALGNQNCADPTGVAHAMRDSDGKPIVIGTQQDASEFNHLFLDIVEKGLRSEASEVNSVQGDQSDARDVPESSSPVVAMDDKDGPENVVKDMFTVRFRQEVRHTRSSEGAAAGSDQDNAKMSDGESNSIIVDATAENDRNLHSGLEDYAFARIELDMAQAQNADPSHSNPASSGPLPALSPSRTTVPAVSEFRSSPPNSPAQLKTVWFTRMPPVVVIYLQRVRFNVKTQQPEKVHDKYEFGSEIAFDRYLEENREASILAREAVLGIRKERGRLQSLLGRYEMFPYKEYPSDGSIKNNGMFESVGPYPAESSQQDAGSTLTTNEDSSRQSANQSSRVNQESLFSAASRVQARLMESLKPSSPLFAVEGIAKENVQTSIEILKTIVEQDRKKCDSFRVRLQSLTEQEAGAYEGLDKVKYWLHAVLVHDGAPSGGHYWTFIRNWNAQADEMKWMKLSDSLVTHVSEEEMLLWSVGGKSRASAYCLIYAVGSTLESKYMYGEKSVSEESRRLLPMSLIEEVQRSAAEFEREIQEQALRDDK